MLKITVITFFFLLLVAPTVFAEPCYPLNTPGCQDVCGDHICGNQEAFDTCVEDCDQCVDTDSEDNMYVKGVITCNWLGIEEDASDKDLLPSRLDLHNQL